MAPWSRISIRVLFVTLASAIAAAPLDVETSNTLKPSNRSILQNSLSSELDPHLQVSILRHNDKLNPLSSYVNSLYALQAMAREDPTATFWIRRFTYPQSEDVLLRIEPRDGSSEKQVPYRLALYGLYECTRQMAVNAWFVDLSAMVSYDRNPIAKIQFIKAGTTQDTATIDSSTTMEDTQQNSTESVFSRRQYDGGEVKEDEDEDEPLFQDIPSTNVSLNASESEPPLGMYNFYPTPRVKMSFADFFPALARGIAQFAFRDPNAAIEPVTLSPEGLKSEVKVGLYEGSQRLTFTNRDAVRMLWFAAKAMVTLKRIEAVSFRVSKKADASEQYWHRVGWINVTMAAGAAVGTSEEVVE